MKGVLKLIILSYYAYSAVSEEICFDEEGLGCFDNKLDCHQEFFPPWTPEEISTEFWLFTRERPVFFEALNTSEHIIEWSHFKSSRDTIVYIHGFTDNMDREWNLNLRDQILCEEDLNVIFVDWRQGADIPLLYYQSLQNARVVAQQTITLIKKIMEVKSVDAKSFYLVGHSTGAHMAGHIAKSIPGIQRVTGLDPAGPNFDEYSHPDCKLDPTDAPLVDVIHTDAFLGSAQTHGDMDFFPNGGDYQPGCWKALLGVDVCDHLRSIRYFAESFDTSECEFKAYPCNSWDEFDDGLCATCDDNGCPVMGYHAKDGAAGKYMLETNGEEPYCIPEVEEEEEDDGGWWFW